MRRSDIFKGRPARPVLNRKRARLYRTVLRKGAKEGPNFAGRFTIVTWGAGLGAFSIAVVDARNGTVHFPPFETVSNTAYGLPYIDKGDNPAWRMDSKLFAFVGRPDVGDKGMGLYVYLFDRGRFRLKYFEKEDEEERKANHEAWEKEIDRRLSWMAEMFGTFSKRVSEVHPDVRCHSGLRGTRYPWASLDLICTEKDLIVSINMEYLSTPGEAVERIKSELKYSSLATAWRPIEGLGEQGIAADGCSRAWVRFRTGVLYVWMNANLNSQQIETPGCSNERNGDSERLAEFANRIASELGSLLSSIRN